MTGFVFMTTALKTALLLGCSATAAGLVIGGSTVDPQAQSNASHTRSRWPAAATRTHSGVTFPAYRKSPRPPAPTTPSTTTTKPATTPSTTATTTPATTATSTTSAPQPSNPSTTATGSVPAGTATNCASVPSRCGYPDATNTGVPAGTALVKVPAQKTSGAGWEWSKVYGSVVTTANNAVISGLDIDGGVQVMHSGVVVEKNVVAACGGENDGSAINVRYRPDSDYYGSNATIRRNTINGTPTGCDHRAASGVKDTFGQAPGLSVVGNNISGTGNGISAEREAVITDNWIHDLGHLAGDHHSGISTHGGAASIVVRHNTVLLHDTPVPGGGGVSAALTIYNDFAHAQNTTLEDNLINGGAYTVFAGNSGDAYDPSKPATNIQIRNNRFVCGEWDYGPVAFYKASSTNSFTGNYCDQNLSAVTP